MIFDCSTIHTAIKVYCIETRQELKNVGLYIDSGLSSLYVNEFRIFGGNNKPEFLINDALKALICRNYQGHTIRLENHRTELQQIAPFNILHFIDVIKKSDFPVKYKVKLYEI